MRTHLLRMLTVSATIAVLSMVAGCSTSSQPTTPPVTPVTKSATPVLPAVAKKNLPTKMASTRNGVDILQFNDTSIKAIKMGTKTSTTRKGVRLFPSGIATAVGNGGERVPLLGVSSMQKKLSELTEDNAMTDGNASVDTMTDAIKKVYPGIGPDDVVSVITFHVAKPTIPATMRAE